MALQNDDQAALPAGGFAPGSGAVRPTDTVGWGRMRHGPWVWRVPSAPRTGCGTAGRGVPGHLVARWAEPGGPFAETAAGPVAVAALFPRPARLPRLIEPDALSRRATDRPRRTDPYRNQ
ncbi:hypothetical protein OG413_30975 [Streptomyces sp. NBC_01433]|uniref:hypothetical protein n=1 Tax=Streptomyces sp. NBC_01433 TaxID=2903864 RepID=UPI00225622C9|nr:hypothetical protein [Streptomyces sp. NBC_01433]MCX4679656.1 hypothetical protein [Streptomyces sp. NBC_01433]